jgi:nicotinamide-nucleotide amidase
VLGVVVYSNEAKMRVLGVEPALLERHGAVSEPVVRNMAEAVRKQANSTFGLAISGVAGPGGGTPEKPVGTVHLALAAAGGTAHVFRLLPGTRSQIKARAAYGALAMLHRHLTEGWLG